MKFKSVIFVLFVLATTPVMAYFPADCTFTFNSITCNSVAGCYSTGTKNNSGTYDCTKCAPGTYKKSYYEESMDGCFECDDKPVFSSAFVQYQSASVVKENTWAWYMAGGESEADCEWVAECAPGYYLENQNNVLSCVQCTNSNHATTSNNRFRGLGNTIQFFTKSVYNEETQKTESVDYSNYSLYACAPNCPKQTVVSADGNSCECDVANGYVSSGTSDANGFPICEKATANITMWAYIFRNEKGNSDDSYTEKKCEFTMRSGSYTDWDSLIKAMGDSECISKFGYWLDSITILVTENDVTTHRTESKDNFETLNIPAGANITAESNLYPEEFNIEYVISCPDSEFLVWELYIQECVYSKECAVFSFDRLQARNDLNFGNCQAFKDVNGIYIKNGKYIDDDYLVLYSDKADNIAPGSDIRTIYSGSDLEVRILSHSCPAGYYCENGEKKECPAGATSEAMSSSIADCYSGGETIISGNNGKFSIPENLNLSAKE